MGTVGVIVEYNPLHNGHMYHLEQAKITAGADSVVAVMSGHFLQRGEPAIINKWARTEMALHAGADVVIELPIAFACSPAEWFAYGAVSALHATGIVDSLCFGSESGDVGWLLELAESMHKEPAAFKGLLKQQLADGRSYPSAYSAAVASFTENTDGRLKQPNNSLGLHYTIALKRLRSAIIPLTITRQKASYHQTDITDQQIASATAIRQQLFSQGSLHEIESFVPAATFHILQREWSTGKSALQWEHYSRPLMHELLSRSAESLAQIADVSEGLEHRIKKMLPLLDLPSDQTVSQLLSLLKTKRYTRTKLQRVLLRILLGHTKSELNQHVLAAGVPYLRILGFTSKGKELLKRMKQTATLPIVQRVTQESSSLLQLDIRATSVYACGCPAATARDWLRDYYQEPVQLKT